MERFEMMIDNSLVEFKSFLGKTKESITTLIDDIKNNITMYESRIKETEEEIEEAESSSHTCEQEISRLQEQIRGLKKSIDNVEKTYKKMVDAYSSTSEGNTKDIYSDIIESARENCERDVEKNNAEIESLNDSIYGIKNNIKEFNSTIDRLNRDLSEYELELTKYTRALQYMQKVGDGVIDDLTDIESGKNSRVKSPIKTVTKPSKPKEEPVEEKVVIEKESEIDKNEELQRIYDLTGYKKEEKKEEPVIDFPQDKVETEESKEDVVEEKPESEPVYSGNLENLFLNSGVEDVKESPLSNPAPQEEYDEHNLSEWEEMLNEKTITFEEPLAPSEEDTVNQLLKPYGTTFETLVSLADDRIEYKDDTILPVEIKVEDVIKVINQINAVDLKSMKIVGPNTTLLKKIKKLKEEEK